MPFPLHKGALGLLEVFNLKTLGQTPPQFGDTVVPTAEVFDLYARDRQQTAQLNVVAAFPMSLTQTFLVPVRLLAVAMDITVGAAGSVTGMNLRLGVRTPSVTFPFVNLAHENIPGITATLTYSCAIALPVPIVLPAQSQLLFLASSAAGGADHDMTGKWLFQSLAP